MREADELIINQVVAGDRNAYAILVDRYKDRVYSLVLGIVRRPELAQEIAQDTFVKAYTSLGKFRKDAGFSTWLYRIAYNGAISETRKKKHRFQSFDEQMEKVASEDISLEQETAEGRSKLLEKAMQELPSQEKLILLLYYFEEKSVDEISKDTGLSVSNVKVKLFRMRGKLKEILARMGMKELVLY